MCVYRRPKAVARVASSILRNPIHVSIGSCDELRANKDIKQHVQVVDNRDKFDKVLAIVKAEVRVVDAPALPLRAHACTRSLCPCWRQRAENAGCCSQPACRVHLCLPGRAERPPLLRSPSAPPPLR